jgi:uncharacterized protein (DUF2141 family)
LKASPSLLLCMALAAAPAAHAVDLSVTVAQVAGADGQVLVGLFNTAESFPRKPLRGQMVPAAQRDKDGAVRVVFTGLPAGSYAVSAVHDRDGDGKLGTNLMGVPNEPYGFSGRSSGRFGAPDFAEAAVALPEAGLAITIPLR